MRLRRRSSVRDRRGRRRTLVAVASSVALMAAYIGTVDLLPASAHISGTTGDVVDITGALPAGVQECGTTGQSANNTANCLSSTRALHQIFAFDEKQNYVLPADLTVNFGPQSPNWAFGTTYSTESQIIGQSYALLAGDTVSSHLLHADLPFSDPATTFSDRSGSTFFSVIPQIYGLIFTDARLGATDSLGAPGVVYPIDDTSRGWEFDCTGTSTFTGMPCTAPYNANIDSFELGPTGELVVSESIGNGMDQTRVLTNVPDAPTITCPGPVTADVGQIAHASGGTFADADSFPTVTVSADRGTVTQVGTGRSGSWSWDLDTSLSLSSGPVTVTATDDQGLTAVCAFGLTVNNVVTQVVPAGGTLNIGGTTVSPTNPTIATVKLPKRVPAASARFAVQAFATVLSPPAVVSMAFTSSALDPDCFEFGQNVCLGKLVSVDVGRFVLSKSKPAKLTMTWVKSPLKDSRASTLWYKKPIPGTSTPGPTVRVPACRKVGKDYVNTPCLSKTSFPHGDYKVIVMLLSIDPKFCRR